VYAPHDHSTTRLVVTAFATGTAGSINPAQPLPHHKWTHVAITVRGGELKVCVEPAEHVTSVAVVDTCLSDVL